MVPARPGQPGASGQQAATRPPPRGSGRPSLPSRVFEPAERPAGLLLGVLGLAHPAPGRGEPAAGLVQLVFQLPDLVLLVALVLGRLVRRLTGLGRLLFRVGDGLPSPLSRPRLLSGSGFRSGP